MRRFCVTENLDRLFFAIITTSLGEFPLGEKAKSDSNKICTNFCKGDFTNEPQF